MATFNPNGVLINVSADDIQGAVENAETRYPGVLAEFKVSDWVTASFGDSYLNGSNKYLGREQGNYYGEEVATAVNALDEAERSVQLAQLALPDENGGKLDMAMLTKFNRAAESLGSQVVRAGNQWVVRLPLERDPLRVIAREKLARQLWEKAREEYRAQNS